MIPKNLEYKHFKKAIEIIKKDGIPNYRESYKYFLIFKGEKYPPKYVIALACKVKNGSLPKVRAYNAVQAKDYFIRRGYTILGPKGKTDISKIKIVDDEKAFPEGREMFKLHKSYERDAKICKLAKEKKLKEDGELICEVCGFSFIDRYGDLGIGFIEAHHKIPVSQLGENGKTRIEDMALLCSNCHQMIHRSRSPLTIEELKALIKY
ncbi:MAG: HNH endonuclease [Syntrophothermus sp.]